MMDWKLTKEAERRLQDIAFSKNVRIQEVSIDESSAQMLLKYTKNQSQIASIWHCLRGPFRKPCVVRSRNQQETLGLESVGQGDANGERDLLLREYEIGHDLGKHWDLLRWNVSKFFLSVETIFVAGATKGLLMLADKPSADTKYLVSTGLILLAGVNIILCVIWLLRNKGIHAWHRASIKRLQLIEADPRLRETLKHNTTIIQAMRGEGFRAVNIHGTGELESWGPPAVFICLWIGVILLCWNLM